MPLFLVFRWMSPDNLTDIVSSPLAWEDCAMSSRPLLFIPHLPLGVDGSNFLADFSAISACSTSSFQLWAFQLPYKSPLGPGSYAYMSARAWVMASLLGTSAIDFWTAQCNHGQILLSSVQWRGVYPWLPRYRPHKNKKGTGSLSLSRNWQSLEEGPLQVPMNSHDSIIIYNVTGLRPEVIDMLV